LGGSGGAYSGLGFLTEGIVIPDYPAVVVEVVVVEVVVVVVVVEVVEVVVPKLQ
jgi:hypothetical protein